MTLNDAKPAIKASSNIPFSTLLAKYSITGIKINKGMTGQLLERLIGLFNSTSNLDFDDGELKTNKVDAAGKPLETMFITQIKSHINELFNDKPFDQSWLYNKIKNLIYVPVVKSDIDPENWFFREAYHVQISKGSPLYNQLKTDYEDIIQKMKSDIISKGDIHTSSGIYIQIRTKDSKPYSPIISSTHGAVSNKNFAFYFKKDFMKDIITTHGVKL
jgi:DNA mismatch repair protein MutH